MSWYAAHIVMYVKFKSVAQRHFPVWENIVLVQARSEKAAFDKAEKLGRMAEGDDDGSFRWGKHPAEWVFAGVHKLTECDPPGERPADGTELTYTEFDLDSYDAVKKLVAGKPVQARFNDRYRCDEAGGHRIAEDPMPAKRKHA